MGLIAKALTSVPTLKAFDQGSDFIRWHDFGGRGISTNSGRSLTVEKALRYSAYWGAVTILSQDVAKLPLHVYREGTRDKATDHWAHELLHRRPHPAFTSYRWRQLAMVHALTYGNFYAGIGRTGSGQITDLLPLSPDRMGTPSLGADGELTYEYTLKNGTSKVEIPGRDVFHLRGLSWDGLSGYSLLSMMREAVALGLSAEEYRARFFKNDARPGVILMSKGKLSKDAIDHLSSTFKDSHEGVANSWRTVVLEEGVDVKTAGIPPKDAQFLEGQEFDVEVLARFTRIPAYKLNSRKGGTMSYASVEQMAQDYVSDSLQPWTENWQQEIDATLLPPDLYSKLDMRGLLRGDTAARTAYYTAMTNMRAFTPNKVLELEDFDPVPWGDEPLSTPNNNAPDPNAEAA